MFPLHLTRNLRAAHVASIGLMLLLNGCQSSVVPPGESTSAVATDGSTGPTFSESEPPAGMPIPDDFVGTPSRPESASPSPDSPRLDPAATPDSSPSEPPARDPVDPVPPPPDSLDPLLEPPLDLDADDILPVADSEDIGQIQSGTLTAGSFDDSLNLESYRSFVAGMARWYPDGGMPALSIGEVATIHVVDAAGDPIGNARVIVTARDVQSQQQRPLIDIPTRSDGRVLFLTAMDGAGDARDFTVTVYPPDGTNAVVATTTLDDPHWEIVLPDTASELPTQLDLAFVVDATGSMGDELEYLKVEMESIAEAVSERFPDVDQRYALIVYRDEYDEYITRTFDFTNDLAEFQTNLSNQHANGGGDYPEAMHTALQEAQGLSWRDAHTARVIFLIADAPPHDIYAEQTLDAIMSLRRRGIAFYPVAASGVAEKAELIMRTAALVMLGEYCFVTDDSGVGNPHAEPNIACYVVQRLDQLMIRMIAGELTGRRIYADPENVIRVVGNPVDGMCLELQRYEQ